MEEMEEKAIREYYYNENKNKMDVISKNFKKSYIYNFYFNIVFSFVSLGGLYLWISFTNAGIKMAHILEEEIGTIHFPWMALSAPIAPLIAIMTFFANAFLIKKLNRISQLLYGIVFLFSLINLFVGFEPMNLIDMLILMSYTGVGIWMEDFAIRNYKDLDYLRKQEGFPDFNYGLEEGRHSKYTRYRERWLKKDKQLDYYTENERPITDFQVIEAEGASMDGIAVDSEQRDGWFENKTVSKGTVDYEDMEVLETVGTVDDSEYKMEDVRRKPLL